MIYFISDADEKVVKIGVSKDPFKRLNELQTGNHLELKILKSFDGTTRHERQLHKKFMKFKKAGEWFIFNAEIRKFIDLIETFGIDMAIYNHAEIENSHKSCVKRVCYEGKANNRRKARYDGCYHPLFERGDIFMDSVRGVVERHTINYGRMAN